MDRITLADGTRYDAKEWQMRTLVQNGVSLTVVEIKGSRHPNSTENTSVIVEGKFFIMPSAIRDIQIDIR